MNLARLKTHVVDTISNIRELKTIEKIDKIEVGFGSKTIVLPEPLLIERSMVETTDDTTDALISIIENLVDIINVERGGKEILE